MRFRANPHIDDAEPWSEAHWLDRKIALGPVRFKTVMRAPRCAATGVNPLTAVREMTQRATMMERYGRRDPGVYLDVVRAARSNPVQY